MLALLATTACTRERQLKEVRDGPFPPVAIAAPSELTRRDSASGIVFDTLAKAPTMSPPPLQRTPTRPPTNTATASPVPSPRKAAGSAVTVDPKTPSKGQPGTTDQKPPARL